MVEASCVLFLTQPACQNTRNFYLRADERRCNDSCQRTHLQLGGGSMVISASSFWIRLADVLRAFDVIFCTAFASFKEKQFNYPCFLVSSPQSSILTFLVSLLGPSLCSPEAPPAEEDDPDAAVAAVAAAEPEADITPLARSTKSSFVSLSLCLSSRRRSIFPADFFSQTVRH